MTGDLSTQGAKRHVPVWSPPSNMREVPSAWWDIVLNGTLWAVCLADMPFYTLNLASRLRFAAYRNAEKRGKKVSYRLDSIGSYAYIQAFPKEEAALNVRQPIENAVAAPGMPPVIRTPIVEPPRPPIFDYTEIMERMLRIQEELKLPPYPPIAVARHAVIGWIAQECTCKTGNLRVHLNTCAIIPNIPILEAQIKFSKEEPEVWCQKQERWGPLYESTRQAAQAAQAVDDARDQVL